ncbi:splicing factor- putative [Striga hermonthica]|uniref:Splicing factor- putative n=1 Tax=Striga hermonthica TaxID=68872 RepID=A0A9N7NBK9_STRHE|nr:splicing factor- putative [Striga hermonthica]
MRSSMRCSLRKGTRYWILPHQNRGQQFDVPKEMPGGLPFMKTEDYQYFGSLLNGEINEEELSPDEQKERKIMKLVLKVKNGTPPQKKTALRQLMDKTREFGAGLLFNRILPLLMQPTLEDQEHLLVKVIDRALYKLDELVRPYVHKILVVIEPLLIDEDYYACVKGREIISNPSKAAGLATMIVAMRPDIYNIDEYVWNTTARAFSVVASALGILSLLPFLKAVCQIKSSWQARHTALVEALAPYGIESFDLVLKPLWKGIRSHLGKVLVAFLKAIGCIIPLMDAIYASYCTKEVMVILIREFQSPNEETKKIVLKVVKQCVSTEGVEPDYIRNDILPVFFRNFWVRRMALDRRNYKQLVETTVEIANKVGVADIVGRIVEDLKMREQTSDDAKVMLNGFGALVNSLGQRVKPYLPQICGTIKWRLNNKSVKENCIDLVGRIADRGSEFVPAREWMRVCLELLEMLKAHKKGIRRATINTFGYIAKALGPQDVLATLLNNLNIQERHNFIVSARL